MKTRLLHLWDILRSGYWFVPAAMGVSAAIFAIGLLWVDRHWYAPVVFGPRHLRNFMRDRQMIHRQGYKEPSDLNDLESRYHRALIALQYVGAPAGAMDNS